MPSPPVPWSGGPPTKVELRRYLNRLGIDEDEQEVMLETYSENPNDPWTRQSLQRYIDTLVAGQERGDFAGPANNFPAVSTMADQVAGERAEDQTREARGQAMRGEAGARMRQQRDQFWAQAAVSYDAGPTMDPDAISQSLALGYRVDENGEPIVDPNSPDGGYMPFTGADLWEQVRGQRFNMGKLQMPGVATQNKPWFDPTRSSNNPYSPFSKGGGSTQSYYGSGLPSGLYGTGKVSPSSYGANRPSIRGNQRFLTPTQAMAMLGSMDEDYVINLQRQLYEAGLYGEDLPSWGEADPATRQAFMALFNRASLRDGIPLNRVLEDMIEENILRTSAEDREAAAAAGVTIELPDFQPEVTSAETLRQTVDDMAQDLLGRFVPDDQREALVATLQQRETDRQRTQWERDVQNAREQGGAQFADQAAQQGGGANEIDRFMAAISGQESGGDTDVVNPDSGAHGEFQIMPGNWSSWAVAAGLPRNAPRTAQNQRLVARHRMLYYFNRFKNWRDVAISWYAGEGAAGGGYSQGALNRPQGGGKYPSINEYVDQIMARFGSGGGAAMSQAGGVTEFGGQQHEALEAFDAQAEAEAILKAQDPAGWESHEFADRAVQFFSLMQGAN